MIVVGHRKQLNYLKFLVKTFRAAHALLFSGQEQIGKRTVALEFIKLLNCKNGVRVSSDFLPCKNGVSSDFLPCKNGVSSDFLPCKNGVGSDFLLEAKNRADPIFVACHCRSCKEIDKQIFPDLKIIQAHGKEIQISQIRELSRFLYLRPFFKYKIAIIDQAHLMTKQAQSCLLKTLEEPKGRTILILISEYPETLLATVLSRAEKITFYPVSSEEIRNHLCSQGLTEAKASEIVSRSFGRPGRAIELARQPKKLEEQNQHLQEVIKLTNADYNARFEYVKNMAQAPDKIKPVLETWLMHFRNKIIQPTKLDNLKPEPNLTPDVDGETSGVELDSGSGFEAAKTIKEIEKTLYLLSSTNISTRLVLENLCFALDK